MDKLSLVIAGFPFVAKGGAENQARILFYEFNKKYDVQVQTLAFSKKANYEFEFDDRLHLFGKGKGKWLIVSGFISLFFRTLFSKDNRILYLHQLSLFTLAGCLAVSRRKKSFVKIANSGELLDLRTVLGLKIFPFVVTYFKKRKDIYWVAISDKIALELKSLGLPNVVRVNNMVNLSSYISLETNFKLVLISRFKKHKNIQFLKTLYDDFHIKIDCEIYGENGDFENDLFMMFSHNEFIKFQKPFQQKDKPYNNSRPVLIHPSLQEGSSNAILEALSRGVPVIANSIEANMNFGTNGENGVFLISVSNPKQWYETIEKLNFDLNFYKKISNNGVLYIRKNHSPEAVIPQYEDYFFKNQRP